MPSKVLPSSIPPSARSRSSATCFTFGKKSQRSQVFCFWCQFLFQALQPNSYQHGQKITALFGNANRLRKLV